MAQTDTIFEGLDGEENEGLGQIGGGVFDDPISGAVEGAVDDGAGANAGTGAGAGDDAAGAGGTAVFTDTVEMEETLDFGDESLQLEGMDF